MAKAFTTATLVRGKEPLLRRLVCEVRYQDGQLYLDRCGRLLKSLLGHAPEWVATPEPTPQGTSVYNLRTGMQLGVSMASASLTLDKGGTDEVIDPAEVDEFLEQVDAALGLVIDELEITQFTRVGYREHYYFPFESQAESEQWLQSLGLITVSSSLYGVFGAQPDALGATVAMRGDDCRYRVGLNGVERAAQVPVGDAVLTVQTSAVHKDRKKAVLEALKRQRQRQVNSAFAVVLDIDAYLIDPAEPDLRAFVQGQSRNNLKRFREALPGESAKKGK